MNTYSIYETNGRNLLGGAMTFENFRDAVESGATEIYIVTYISYNNNMGIKVNNALCKRLWRSLIWRKK